MAVVQLPGGQFQVQGVIQSAQSSVIQSPQVQAAQVSPLDSPKTDTNQSPSVIITVFAAFAEHRPLTALIKPTCALLRPLAQTVTIHRTRQTVESVPKRPEKFWLEGRHTGNAPADRPHAASVKWSLDSIHSNLVEKS